MLNPFAEQYSKLSNQELVEILTNKEDYQELAVEAALNEIENRNLSEEDYAKELAFVNTKKEKLNRSIPHIFDDALKKNLTELNPLRSEKPNVYQQINIMCVTLAIFFLINFASRLSSIWYLATNIRSCDIQCLFILFSFMIMPLTIGLFWGKKKAGWLLLCFIMSYNGLSSFISIFYMLDLVAYRIVAIAVMTAILWAINKEDVRKIYDIKKDDFVLPMTTGFVAGTLNLLLT